MVIIFGLSRRLRQWIRAEIAVDPKLHMGICALLILLQTRRWISTIGFSDVYRMGAKAAVSEPSNLYICLTPQRNWMHLIAYEKSSICANLNLFSCPLISQNEWIYQQNSIQERYIDRVKSELKNRWSWPVWFISGIIRVFHRFKSVQICCDLDDRQWMKK